MGMFTVYFHKKFQMPGSNILLVIAPNAELQKILTLMPPHYLILYRIHLKGLTNLFAE